MINIPFHNGINYFLHIDILFLALKVHQQHFQWLLNIDNYKNMIWSEQIMNEVRQHQKLFQNEPYIGIVILSMNCLFIYFS